MKRRTLLGSLIGAAAAILIGGVAWAAETELSDPKPSFDAPRQILLTLTTKDEFHVNNVLYNVVNIQKFYGMDNVQVAVVAWGPGVRAMLKEDSPVADRIASLLKYDVEFIACGNTLTTIGKTEEDLLPGIKRVTAGIPEVVERRLRGWQVITP